MAAMLATIGLLLVLVAVAAGGWLAIKYTPKNIDPVPIDQTWSSIGTFYRGRPDRDTEVDLGDRWSSSQDPGAAFEVSWISHTRELVVLRHQAHPDLISGAGVVSAVPGRLDPRATGMKVLAVADLDTIRATHPERLVATPDGLDQLTTALGHPYQPPHPDDAHWANPGPPPQPRAHPNL
jgi:hypothetical protein